MRAGLLVAIVLHAGTASADEAANYAGNLEKLIDRNWSKVEGPDYWLHDDVLSALSESPPSLAIVAAAAAKQIRKLYVREEPWEKLVAFLLKATERCLAKTPKNTDAIRARADALLTRARLAVELEREPKAADYETAVDLLLRLHAAAPDKGRHLVEAARILMDEHRDEARLRKVCKEGRARYPKESVFRVAAMRQRLDAAKDDESLRKLLDDWKPLGESYRAEMLALYNEAVTVAKLRKLRTKHDWMLHTDRRFTYGVMFDIPWHRWAGHDELKQYGRDGTVSAWIRFEREGATVTAKWAKMRAEQFKRALGGKFTMKPAKRKLSRHFRSCWSFAMGGSDKKGDFVHVRCYFLRTQTTLAAKVLRIEVRSRSADADPEIEQILSSMRPYSLKPGR